jgi:protein-L-isoaspartate(D-aspartate) O-methyltransferase
MYISKQALYLAMLSCVLVAACAPGTAPPTTEAVTKALANTPTAPSPTLTPTAPLDPYQQARLDMVRRQIEPRGVNDPAVLEAMRTVPRHLFVPQDWLDQAYDDHPLPIGYGQTISQPYIVAWMTELLQVTQGDKVLEVGTGSGYQAAVLGELGIEVYTVEIVEALATQVTKRLSEMHYDNITVAHKDGYHGWEEHAPFDAIIVTCAPDHVPPELIQQLDDDGRLVIPVGPPGGYQNLFLITKQDGRAHSQSMGGVRFVPLTR